MSSETNEFKKLVGYPTDYVDQYKFSADHAYKDLQRTLRGIGKNPKSKEAKADCEKAITIFAKKCETGFIKSQEDFDEEHRKLCDQLIFIYGKNNFHDFTYGQAQKWINMSIKYLYCFDEKRFGGTLPFIHIAIDNYIFNAISTWQGYDEVKFYPWSKLKDYSKYLGFQKWFKEQSDDIPLIEEFKLWRVQRNKEVKK